MAGAREAAAAHSPSTSASHKSRPLWTRASYSRRPRPMASTGETSEASRAGEYADATATPTPIASASSTEAKLNSIGPGRLLTYSDSTVLAINFTAPVAMKRPSGSPISAPASPEAACLPHKCRENRPAARAQRAHNPDLRTPPDHGNRNRVVNEKRSDDERNITQQPQIPPKRRQHAAILIRARALRANLHSGWQNGAQTLLPLVKAGYRSALSAKCDRRVRTASARVAPPQCPSRWRIHCRSNRDTRPEPCTRALGR